MNVTSAIPDLSPDEVRGMLAGLPRADGYDLHVKYLRYREKPHLSAWTDFTDRSITLQVPEPFLPFGEVVPYGAMRRPGAGKGKLRFIWLTEGLTFREPREVLRFLYCHEWMHVFGHTRTSGRKVGEIRCDRFALFNFLKESVTVEDAEASLRWQRHQ
jgi:hypothetical protein